MKNDEIILPEFVTPNGRHSPFPGKEAIWGARLVALKARKTYFVYFCEICETMAIHDAETSECGNCRPTPRLARISARNAKRAKYLGVCAEHGPSEHWVTTGRCATCYAANNAKRAPASARAFARKAKRATYLATCAEHGETLHWVSTGRCATCYASNNVKRKRPGYAPRVTPERLAAQQAGQPRYQDDCRLHGRVAHHTVRGVCLSCYTTLGKPRDAVFVRYCPTCSASTVWDATGCIECR